MKKFYLSFLIFGLAIFCFGCAGKQIDPNALQSEDEKAIYQLMLERCNAVYSRDLKSFQSIYVEDSPELIWIERQALPMWTEYEVTYTIHSLKKISIVGNDAAANFILYHNNKYGTVYYKDVEVLYVKKGSQWKIVSVGER